MITSGQIILGLIIFLFGFGILSMVLSLLFDNKPQKIISNRYNAPTKQHSYDSGEEAGVIFTDDDS